MDARLCTSRERIRGVAKSYRDQQSSVFARYPERAVVADQLDALDPETATVADVEALMGKVGWVTYGCDGCDKRGFDVVVEVGAIPDYESNTATLCRECAAKALALFGE